MFATVQSKKSPAEFADEVMKEADLFNGFNLILADLRTETMVYVTNRPEGDQKFVTEVSPGIHVLTNASLDTPWPKVRMWADVFLFYLPCNCYYLHKTIAFQDHPAEIYSLRIDLLVNDREHPPVMFNFKCQSIAE